MDPDTDEFYEFLDDRTKQALQNTKNLRFDLARAIEQIKQLEIQQEKLRARIAILEGGKDIWE